MKYIVYVRASAFVDAETPEKAADKIRAATEETFWRDFSGMDDQILSSVVVGKVKLADWDE